MSVFKVPYHVGNFGNPELVSEDHEELAERLCKTLYYGKQPKTDRPSLPLTEVAMEFFQEASSRKLGRIDPYFASTTARQACVSPCSMMTGMMYTRRLRNKNPEYLHSITSSDLFFISMMMASKYMYDEGTDDEVFNDEWAASADLETEEVNEMERQFLSAIDWELFVRRDEFESVLHDIEKRIAVRQGIDRGWFSYTDLWIISHDLNMLMTWQFLKGEMSKVFLACSLTYTAGILTMIGSTILVTSAATFLVPMATCVRPSLHHMPISPAHVLPAMPEGQKLTSSTKEVSTLRNLLSHLLTLVAIPSMLVMMPDSVPKNSPEMPKNYSRAALSNEPSFRFLPSVQENGKRSGEFCKSPGARGKLSDFPSENGQQLSDDQDLITSTATLMYTVLLTVQEFFTYSINNVPLLKKRKPESGLDQQIVCGVGPCVMNSNMNCRNVSTRITDCEQVCPGCEQYRKSDEHEQISQRGCCCDREQNQERQPKLACTAMVQCCCDQSIVASVDRGGGFLDVSLGFHTQNQIFIGV